jgi:PTH1 family peptidyl-tRNA hydrolase
VDRRTIVLGLGNPGLRYRPTRHNMGFRVLDRLAEKRGARFGTAGDLGRRTWFTEVEMAGGTAVLAKPRSYMNRSGRAAAALCRHFESGPESLLVVYDDADLALGRIRLRRQGGAGGHNGIRSMIEVLGTGEFGRVRLGVRGEERDETDLAEYVLEPFTDEEETIASLLVELGVDAVEAILADGMAEAMNTFNGRSVAPEEKHDAE